MKVVDLSYLHSVCDGNSELENSLIDLFLSQLPEFESNMFGAYSTNNYLRLAAEAHKAKSSVVSMGMQDLGLALKRLEMMAKLIYLESPDADDKKIADYQHQLDSLPEELKNWIFQNKSKKNVFDLINFYKLQSEMAKEDLAEVHL